MTIADLSTGMQTGRAGLCGITSHLNYVNYHALKGMACLCAKSREA